VITYVIFDSLTGLFKIGKTSDMRKRFSTLSTSNLNLHIVLQLRHVEESLLHTLFKDKRVKKEWFKLTLKDIEDITELEHESSKDFLR
jgi:hypothetical protein